MPSRTSRHGECSAKKAVVTELRWTSTPACSKRSSGYSSLRPMNKPPGTPTGGSPVPWSRSWPLAWTWAPCTEVTGSAKSSGDTEDHQRAAGVAGVAAECGGDVRGACQAQDADDEVAEGGHDLWSCTGADLGVVLGEGHVPHPVQAVLDLPVAAEPPGELGGSGLVRAQVGDRVDGLGVPPAASGCRAGAAAELDRLGG